MTLRLCEVAAVAREDTQDVVRLSGGRVVFCPIRQAARPFGQRQGFLLLALPVRGKARIGVDLRLDGGRRTFAGHCARLRKSRLVVALRQAPVATPGVHVSQFVLEARQILCSAVGCGSLIAVEGVAIFAEKYM